MGASMSAAFARPLESAATETRVYQSSWIASMKNHARLPQHNGANGMTIASYPIRRNFQRRDSRTLQQHYSTRDVTEAVSGVLTDFQAKEIAEASGSSVRAAENAKQGMNAMSLAHFLNACREIPELRAMAMKMMGCETVIDPDRERALAMLVASYVRRET